MWTSIIRELLDSGLTQSEIAKAISASQALISQMLRGDVAEPSWRKGDALKRLHKSRCGTKKAA